MGIDTHFYLELDVTQSELGPTEIIASMCLEGLGDIECPWYPKTVLKLPKFGKAYIIPPISIQGYGYLSVLILKICFDTITLV